MRRALVLVGVLLVVAACTATTETDESTTSTTSTTTGPGSGPDPEPEATTSTGAEATTSTPGGGDVGVSRDNPVPVGEAGVVGNYEVVVVGYEADATETVLAENEFNEPPTDPESVFSLISLSITRVGEGSGEPWLDLTWSGVGASNVAASEDDCSTYPNNIFDVGEMFTDGTAEANVCLTVKSADADSLLLILEESFSAEETRRFFALP